MNKLLIFAVWLLSLGAAIQWGNGWWIFGIVLAGFLPLAWRRRRKESTPLVIDRSRKVPDELFTVPPLLAAGPFLTAPGWEGRLRREEATARRQKRWENWLPLLLLLLGIPVMLVLIVMKPTIGGAVLMAAGAGFGLAAAAGIAVRRRRKKRFAQWNSCLGEARDAWLAVHPRPVQDWSAGANSDYFCRHYSTPTEAEAACILAEQAGIGFAVYPQDSFRLAAGNRYARLMEGLESIGVVDVPAEFGGAAQALARRLHSCYSKIPEGLSPENKEEPPPLSAPLERVRKEIQENHWNVLDEDLFREEIRQRPEMSERLFCSYWPSAEEADIALRIRRLAIAYMEREVTMMCYPNDPMPLLLYIADDSMESVEFILAMEQEFLISVSDAEAEKMLSRSFAEMVDFVRKKQREPVKKEK